MSAQDFSEDQRRYLEGFVSGIAARRAAQGLKPLGRVGGGAGEPTGFDKEHLAAMARCEAAGKKLSERAKREEHLGDGDIRLTVWQNLLVSGIAHEDRALVEMRLAEIGLAARATSLRAGVIACTGNTGCKFALATPRHKASAHFYDCGDAKRMAKDVETALTDISAKAGQMSQAAARDFVAELKAAGRYQADVY